MRGLGFRGLGVLGFARIAPPHTKVCGWRHITHKATSPACVIELGETGSYHKPARCDDTPGTGHPLMGGNGPRGPGGNLGVQVFRAWV